jgi:hypothetical protein
MGGVIHETVRTTRSKPSAPCSRRSASPATLSFSARCVLDNLPRCSSHDHLLCSVCGLPANATRADGEALVPKLDIASEHGQVGLMARTARPSRSPKRNAAGPPRAGPAATARAHRRARALLPSK